MNKKQIFEFRDYKAFLRQALDENSLERRGSRSRLAEAVNCHTAYVSQVLNGKAHFNLEQIELAARHLELGKDETTYLLTLLQHNRAATLSLKKHLAELLDEQARKQLVLKDRLEFKRTLSREDQATFYSAWYYGAIHVMVSLPGLDTEAALAKCLHLPRAKVAEVLGFLVEVGLLTRKEGSYRIGTGHIHLEHDSPMISKHHTNWRMRAIQSLDEVLADDLHYSSVVTCAAEDAVKIKQALVKAIEEVRKIVRPSQDEEGFAYCVDFFGLGRNR